jgi:hypothetical protein
MLYEIYLENGGSPWLAFQTSNETEANEYFQQARALYVYFRVLDEKGGVVSITTRSSK